MRALLDVLAWDSRSPWAEWVWESAPRLTDRLHLDVVQAVDGSPVYV